MARRPAFLGAERAAYFANLRRPLPRGVRDDFWMLKEFLEANVFKRSRFDQMLQAHETAAFLV